MDTRAGKSEVKLSTAASAFESSAAEADADGPADPVRGAEGGAAVGGTDPIGAGGSGAETPFASVATGATTVPGVAAARAMDRVASGAGGDVRDASTAPPAAAAATEATITPICLPRRFALGTRANRGGSAS